MKLAFRLYRRGGVYYCQHNETGRQESLRTSDAGEAARLLHARNEASRMAGLNLAIARAYMVAADPRMPERTWKEVIDFMCDTHNGGATGDRLITASKDKALASHLDNAGRGNTARPVAHNTAPRHGLDQCLFPPRV